MVYIPDGKRSQELPYLHKHNIRENIIQHVKMSDVQFLWISIPISATAWGVKSNLLNNIAM
jgi:hypothetical protein